jgi:hypothetical protein
MDDQDKLPSPNAGEAPRRSTSSLDDITRAKIFECVVRSPPVAGSAVCVSKWRCQRLTPLIESGPLRFAKRCEESREPRVCRFGPCALDGRFCGNEDCRRIEGAVPAVPGSAVLLRCQIIAASVGTVAASLGIV